MVDPVPAKSTVEEIRARFDADVERFSNLETGQTATIDAPLVLDLITDTAVRLSPAATSALDIGCGAGNYTLRLLEKIGPLRVTLIDLSRPMLDRAGQRLAAAGCQHVELQQADVRTFAFPAQSYDIVMAAAVLHHLREDSEWEHVFRQIFQSLKPGGSFWISDLVIQEDDQVDAVMWERYAAYLETLNGADYRDRVLAYVEREDTPRPVTWQLKLLERVGFASVEILHKHACFAAFGGLKAH
ncbi:MAG TPA: class I SAM-dependent methyltransferase [Pirellulales bacterium]|nr:class I SAM-dependent methyltransferase [Pirellulales bacterium]